MTVSSPILSTSVQPLAPEKRPLLADLLTKVVPSPHSTAAISISSQQVREQLTLMLNSKSLHHPMKALSRVGAVASSTVATAAAATATVLPNRTFKQLDSILHCKTSGNSGPGLVQICLSKNYAASASSQLPNSVVKPTLGGEPTMLGKRTSNSEDRSSSCHPAKKSLIACKALLSRSLDKSYSAKSDSGSNPRSESAATLMPVLASALLTNDNVSSSSTASLPTCIPTVVLMPKPGMTSQGLASSKNQVPAGLSHVLRSDSARPTVQKETSVSALVSSKGTTASLRDELTGELESQSNRIKKNLFLSEDSSPKREEKQFQKHIEKLAVLISERERCEQLKAAPPVGNQVLLPSGTLSVSSPMLSSSLLNSLIMSNASFLSVAPGPSSISSFVMAPSFLQQQQPQRLATPSGSRDAFQIQDASVNAASAAAAKCVLPFLASQGETVYLVQQQTSSSPAVAKPMPPPAIAFPNQAPLILVLANPSLPGMALASSQLQQQTSLAAGTPKLAINTQPLELSFGNHGGSAAPIVISQASQTMIPSQTVVVGNKPVNHAFQTFTFASQAPQSFIVTSQAAKTLVAGGSTPAAVTFSNRAPLNCGGNTGTHTFTVLNHGFQQLDCVNPVGMVETGISRQATSTNVGLSARPMFFGNQTSERFILANLSANQTPQLLNVNAHLKDNVGVTSLATYNPALDNQAVANQLPQLLVAISGASPQILCAAAKNSVGPLQPVISQLAFKASSTPPKIGPSSICMLRRPSPTEHLQASPVPSVRCCNILQSPGGVQSASTPIILLQAPLSKATAAPSETLVSLAIPAAVSSFPSTPRSSTLSTTPSQQQQQNQPLMFKVVAENNIHSVDQQNPQRIRLNTMPLNGGLEMKMQLDRGECQTNVDILRSCCAASTISESICTPFTENQVLGKSMHLLNGSRVKTITIKKLTTPPVGHAASSTVTGQSSSLIKTLLTNREPDRVLFLDNHDILNSVFRVGQNACVVGDSTREMMRRDNCAAVVEICKSCGSVLDRSGGSGEAWNSVGVCVACHSSL